MKRIITVLLLSLIGIVGSASASPTYTPCVYHGVQRDFGGILVNGVCKINTR